MRQRTALRTRSANVSAELRITFGCTYTYQHSSNSLWRFYLDRLQNRQTYRTFQEEQRLRRPKQLTDHSTHRLHYNQLLVVARLQMAAVGRLCTELPLSRCYWREVAILATPAAHILPNRWLAEWQKTNTVKGYSNWTASAWLLTVGLL